MVALLTAVAGCTCTASPQLPEGADDEQRAIAEVAQGFLNRMCSGDFDIAFDMIEKSHPGIWKDRADFVRKMSHDWNWPAPQTVTKVERYLHFARAARQYNGKMAGYVFLVSRHDGWKVTFVDLMRWDTWQEFIAEYLYDRSQFSRETPALRDATQDIGQELAEVLVTISKEWSSLAEGRPATVDRGTLLLDLLKSNYLVLRRQAYEILRKEYGWDHGIGDEFVPLGSQPSYPEWWVRWFHRQ